MNNQPVRTTKTILEDYKRVELISKRDLNMVDPRTRPGHEAAMRKARLDLPKMRIEYLSAISKKSFGFFVSGDAEKAQKFATIAAESGAFTVNAAAIFDVLADRIQPSIGGRKEFSVTQVGLLDQGLRELVQKTGYSGTLNRVDIKSIRVVSNREQLVAYIRELVMRTNGTTPSAVFAQGEIIRQALAQDFTGQRMVVTVLNATNLDRTALSGLFTKTAMIDVDSVEAVNERFAKDSIMGVLNPGYVPATAPQKQPEVIVPATQPTTTEPNQEK